MQIHREESSRQTEKLSVKAPGQALFGVLEEQRTVKV